jgi:hypothetical protein
MARKPASRKMKPRTSRIGVSVPVAAISGSAAVPERDADEALRR